MRFASVLASIALCLALGLPSPIAAQERGPLRINGVRVGFSPSQAEAGLFKPGAWAPVYIDLEAGPQGLPRGQLTVEAVDPDEIRNRYTTPLPVLESGEQTTVISYQRPGSPSADITVNVNTDDKPVASQQDVYPGLELGQQLILCVGSRLNHLRQALLPKSQTEEDQAALKEEDSRRVAVVETVAQLPNTWFAYEGVDLLLLTTGNREFVTALQSEREGRKEALVEWVRRGGKLVVSTSRNQDIVAKLDSLSSIFPVTIAGSIGLPQIVSVRNWRGVNNPPLQNAPPRANPDANPPLVEIARLEPKPNRDIDVRLRESGDTPIIVQGAYGLGRVTLIAFDLDELPFKTWPGAIRKDNFWEKLLEINSLPKPTTDSLSQQRNLRYMSTQNSSDLAGQLVMRLEDFEDVPVISFGWVALFILLYILLVGPLDYLFLKKVVKRLELTWITFPTVVVTISIVAYFTAYWLKGNDQKINKIDLLDIDPQTQQMYGHSWYTIFSPRIQNYTLGLEAPQTAWGPAPPTGTPQDITMSWMARPDTGFGGSGRTGSQGLFRRAYQYTSRARSLLDVPLQVWSTKSFTATWEASYDPAHPPVSSNIHHAAKGFSLTGTITSHLPVDLVDVVLYFTPDRKWYSLDRLLPGLPERVDGIQAGGQGMSTEAWFTTSPARSEVVPRSSQGSAAANLSTFSIIKRLLFSQMDSSGSKNYTIGQLDQSWRLGHPDVVFVVGRIPRQDGPAEDVTRSPASPTALWLGALTGSGEPRPALPGTLSQETYVRFTLPVLPED